MQNNQPFTLLNVDTNITPDIPQPTIGLIGMGAMGYIYAMLLSQAGWKSLCIFVVSTSTGDILTCLRAPRILVCNLPEKYEKLEIDFPSTLLSLLSGFKAQFTMLFVNRHARSPPSEGWKCNFEVIWLYHLFRRSRVHRVRCYGPEQTRLQLSTHMNVSYESECNRCWPDIYQGPEKAAFEVHLPKDVQHSLLSFVVRTKCEPRWTTSRTTYPSVFGPGTHWFTRVPIRHRASKDAWCPHSRREYPALISFPLCLPFWRTQFCNSQHSGGYPCCFHQVNDPWRFSVHFLWLTEDDYFSIWSHPVISMGTAWASTWAYPWPLRWWDWDCESEPHTWNLSERLACLCRTRHFEPSARARIHQYVEGASESFKLMSSSGRGSLEDKVKFKERVQWARRTVF